MVVLGEIRYESHDLKSLLQLQLLSSNEAVQKIEELKKKVEDTKSDLYIVETAASEAKMRHRSIIEANRVAAVEEKKDKILKLEQRLTSNGYNLCLKKMAKAYPKVDTELLDQIEVSDDESEEYEDDEEPNGSPAS
ncbi:hypothetical protein F0562_022494 [Nyssa sinensis]|uniref:Uncharacterized protein n=1 Tax=Nyssa sinensis TaxID=561372 RepID=A0A5J5BP57_9ASTE|nr:hypothetical protein F0562_022494 [Nyssa sinensis]